MCGHHWPWRIAYALERSFTTSKKIFDLPYEDKMKAPHPDGLVPHRGYSGPGREQVHGSEGAKTDNKVKKRELQKYSDYKVGSL